MQLHFAFISFYVESLKFSNDSSMSSTRRGSSQNSSVESLIFSNDFSILMVMEDSMEGVQIPTTTTTNQRGVALRTDSHVQHKKVEG